MNSDDRIIEPNEHDLKARIKELEEDLSRSMARFADLENNLLRIRTRSSRRLSWLKMLCLDENVLPSSQRVAAYLIDAKCRIRTQRTINENQETGGSKISDQEIFDAVFKRNDTNINKGLSNIKRAITPLIEHGYVGFYKAATVSGSAKKYKHYYLRLPTA